MCIFLSVFKQVIFIAINYVFGLSFTVMLYFLLTILFLHFFPPFLPTVELVKSPIFCFSLQFQGWHSFCQLIWCLLLKKKTQQTSCVLITCSLHWWGKDYYSGVTGMAEYLILDSGQFVSHIYSLSRRGGHSTLCRAIWELYSETEWTAWRGAHYSIKSVRWTLVFMRGCYWLILIIVQVTGNWSLLLGIKQDVILLPLIKRVVWLGTLLEGAEWGGKLRVRPLKALSVSPGIEAALNIGS